MTTSPPLLCRYRYDALNVLTGVESLEHNHLQRFYRHQYLVTELQGQASQCVFQQGGHLLAVQSRTGESLKSQLLVTDQQRSVLQLSDPSETLPLVYSPYGHCQVKPESGSLLKFNGEREDPVTGFYLLGNGHRAFNPVLMRFNSPDRLSPFDKGGLNPYAYCSGDPVNFRDPSGRSVDIAKIISSFGALFNASISLKPSISFQVAYDALANGGVFRLRSKYAAGAISTVLSGAMGPVGGVAGVASAFLTVFSPSSFMVAPLAYTSLGTTAVAVVGRAGSYWVARDPGAMSALTELAAGSPINSVATGGLKRRAVVSIEMDNFDPSAPPLSPGPLTPSAPPLTPDAAPPVSWRHEQHVAIGSTVDSDPGSRRRPLAAKRRKIQENS